MEGEQRTAFRLDGVGRVLRYLNGPQFQREDLKELLERAAEAGSRGVQVAKPVKLRGGGLGEKTDGFHAVEQAVDLGVMAWRQRPGGGKLRGEARITAQGQELLNAMQTKGRWPLAEALARTEAGLGLGTKMLDIAEKIIRWWP